MRVLARTKAICFGLSRESSGVAFARLDKRPIGQNYKSFRPKSEPRRCVWKSIAILFGHYRNLSQVHAVFHSLQIRRADYCADECMCERLSRCCAAVMMRGGLMSSDDSPRTTNLAESTFAG